jgi:hypothetical protein
MSIPKIPAERFTPRDVAAAADAMLQQLPALLIGGVCDEEGTPIIATLRTTTNAYTGLSFDLIAGRELSERIEQPFYLPPDPYAEDLAARWLLFEATIAQRLRGPLIDILSDALAEHVEQLQQSGHPSADELTRYKAHLAAPVLDERWPLDFCAHVYLCESCWPAVFDEAEHDVGEQGDRTVTPV